MKSNRVCGFYEKKVARHAFSIQLRSTCIMQIKFFFSRYFTNNFFSSFFWDEKQFDQIKMCVVSVHRRLNLFKVS